LDDDPGPGTIGRVESRRREPERPADDGTHGPHRYRERDLRAEVERRFDRPVIALEPGG
jgi:hypothetical protein